LSVVLFWIKSLLIQLWHKNKPLKYCRKLTITLSDKTAKANPWEDYLWNHNQSLESSHFSVETNGLCITS